jgi:hypothetical protein
MSDTTPTPTIPTAARVFHSIAAAEEAYRTEVLRNEVFSAKFDVLGAKLDRLTTALERLSTAMTIQTQPPLPSSSSHPLEETTAKIESTPALSALTPPPPSPTSSGLRELQLPEAYRIQQYPDENTCDGINQGHLTALTPDLPYILLPVSYLQYHETTMIIEVYLAQSYPLSMVVIPKMLTLGLSSLKIGSESHKPPNI